ncbi:hypothetical protein AB6A40_007946 [Gnathostoma spinigerum]|uniref:Ribosomal RNA-processing protein 14/surfeit locus protein 6 C-terminal domain-containing protein n=1 Tax=Gnathostoma spinigerum TaxID=75299 RepID=A0ABD6EPY7_9BILA
MESTEKASREICTEQFASLVATERVLLENADLVPIDKWGFEESVKEEIRRCKHTFIDSHLKNGQKRRLNKNDKHHMAKCYGGVLKTVSEVLDWMRENASQTRPKRLKVENNVAESQNIEHSEAFENKKVAKITRKAIKNSDEALISEMAEETSADNCGSSTKQKKEVTRAKSQEKGEGNEELEKSKAVMDGSDSHAFLNASSPSDESRDIQGTTETETTSLLLDPAEIRKLNLEKLQKRIKELKTKRYGSRNAQEVEERRKIKRRLSKMKLKDKKKMAKVTAKEIPSDSVTKEEPTAKRVKSSLVSAVETSGTEDAPVFSKFDFIVKDEEKKTKNDKRDVFKGKDYRALLMKAEKRKERLERIRNRDKQKAWKIEENIRWKRAMSRVEGVKVKDDPELLQRGLKHKEAVKTSRKKKWDERLEHVRAKQEKHLRKRNENIRARKETVKKKKLTKARKKGRIL